MNVPAPPAPLGERVGGREGGRGVSTGTSSEVTDHLLAVEVSNNRSQVNY